MKNLAKIIEKTYGKFFTVVFTKKDGTERVLNGRLGVKSALKGGKSTVDPNKYIVVYEANRNQYRAVNKETIKEVRFAGKIYR